MRLSRPVDTSGFRQTLLGIPRSRDGETRPKVDNACSKGLLHDRPETVTLPRSGPPSPRLRTILRALTATLIAAAVLAPAASAAPGMVVGAAEDAARTGSLVDATTKMNLARLAGFDAIRLTSIWRPGRWAPAESELAALRGASGGAQLTGMRVFLAVYTNARWTPRTPKRRAQFASYAAQLARSLPGVTDVIVGNEPNLNRFWMPQFDRHGRDTAAPAYVRLLAQTYDALKKVSPDIVVVGGAVSPRGSDNFRLKRHTHSPTRFILDMGRAYRTSGRKLPLMDALALHPYPDARGSVVRPHPRSTTIGIGDYGKLVRVLGRAFNGTAQAGSTLPIVYAEFGIESKIPRAKRRVYSHLKAKSAKAGVSEGRQAVLYRQALAVAQCQPTVVGVLLFHVTDERDARAWQSGVYYADDTPKSSLRSVRIAAELAREGKFVSCAKSKPVNPVERLSFPEDVRRVDLVCDRPCRYVAELVALPADANATPPGTASTVSAQGEGAPGEEHAVDLASEELAPGRYRYVVRVSAIDSPGAAVVRFGPSFTVDAAPAETGGTG